MNQTSAQTSGTSQSGASLLPDGIATITTVHLLLVLIVAIAAIAIIVSGIRRKRSRDQAARQVVRHAEEAGMEAPSAEPAPPPAVAAPPVVQPPMPAVAPAPSLSPAPTPSPTPSADDAVTAPRLADEPIAAAPPLGASPAGEALDPAPAPPETSPADGPVTQLKGLGPKVATRLGELGITRIGQIAMLDDTAAAALDAQLGTFSGRMARDRWVEQARFLSQGDRAGFEAVFGRL